MVKDADTFGAKVTMLAAVVNKAVTALELTVIAMVTVVPAASVTVICAEPAAIPVTIKEFPLIATVATAVLLLLTR